MRRVARLSLDYRRAFFAAIFCVVWAAPASASSPQFRRVGTIDAATATANQACYWNGADLECNSTNPTITATGLVGIGTTSPAQLLSLYNANQAFIQIDQTAGVGNDLQLGITSGSGGYFPFSGSSDSILRSYGIFDLGTQSNASLNLATNGVQRLVISGAGNVGIGTTSPTSPLHVYMNALSPDPVMIQNAAIAGYAQIDFKGSGHQWQTGVGGGSETLYGVANKYFVYDQGAGTMRMVIDTSGNVGIGTTAPTVALDISQKTDAVSLPVGTTGTRPTGVNGMIRYNSALPGLEAYVNGVWSTLQSSGTTSGVLGVSNGGTGDSSLTAHGVIVGEGTSPLTATAAGAYFTVLVGNGTSGDPFFSNAPTVSGALTSSQSIGATSTNGLVLQNTTAAASGAQQWSPRVHFSGQGWKTTSTAASQAVDMIEELQPVQGTTNPTGNLTWSSSVNGGSYNPLMTLTSGGNVGIGTTAPAALLSVYAGTYPASGDIFSASESGGDIGLRVDSYSNVWLTNNSELFGYDTDVSHPALSTTNNPLYLTTDLDGIGSNDNIVLKPNGTGKVGIGTTSPGSSLQVNGGAAVGYSTSTAAPTNGLAVSGNVAVGTTTVPASVTEAVNGLIKVAGTGSEPCTAAQVGSMRYNPTGNYFELCSYP